MREQHDISLYQLFTDFHSVLTGSALKWCWQILEDNAEKPDFGYLYLKAELRKFSRNNGAQTLSIESFEYFYGEVQNPTFRLRKRIPETG